MIVLDASVVVELLLNSDLAEPIRGELLQRGESLIAPHLIDVEVLSAIRRLVAGQRVVDPHRGRQILEELSTLPAERFPHTPMLARIWELRNNFTAYDAAYIALAEATGAPLFTCDEKMLKGHRAEVVLFSR